MHGLDDYFKVVILILYLESTSVLTAVVPNIFIILCIFVNNVVRA